MLPPYRVGLFRALAASEKLDFTFAFGLARRGSGLEDVDPTDILPTLPIHNYYLGPHGTATIQAGLLRHVATHQWDVIVASLDPRLVLNLLALPLAKRRGIRFVWWGHGLRPRQRFAGLYKRLVLSADALILYGEQGKQQLAALGIPPERMFVAQNSIDTALIDSLRSTDWSGRYRLLCIGRLVPGKRVDLLLKAFSDALPHLPSNVRLCIVGEGPEEEALKALSISLGIQDRVDWAGPLYGEDNLAPIFNSSLLSITAGYVGLSAIHSLAYGVPKLYADDEPHSPEIEALIPGENSMTFVARDSASLTERMIELIANPIGLKRLGTTGALQMGERFGLAKMVEAFERAVEFACR